MYVCVSASMRVSSHAFHFVCLDYLNRRPTFFVFQQRGVKLTCQEDGKQAESPSVKGTRVSRSVKKWIQLFSF